MICLSNPKDCNWGQEMMMASKLLKQYPNFNFWSVLELDWKPKSLTYFLKSGKKILDEWFLNGAGEEAFERFKRLEEKAKLEKPVEREQITLDQNAGFIYDFKVKPKNLKEFLK